MSEENKAAAEATSPQEEAEPKGLHIKINSEEIPEL